MRLCGHNVGLAVVTKISRVLRQVQLKMNHRQLDVTMCPLHGIYSRSTSVTSWYEIHTLRCPSVENLLMVTFLGPTMQKHVKARTKPTKINHDHGRWTTTSTPRQWPHYLAGHFNCRSNPGSLVADHVQNLPRSHHRCGSRTCYRQQQHMWWVHSMAIISNVDCSDIFFLPPSVQCPTNRVNLLIKVTVF